MFARRVFRVTWPATTIRRGSQLQRRFIHPPSSQLQALPCPSNLKPVPLRLAVASSILVKFGTLIISLLPTYLIVKKLIDSKANEMETNLLEKVSFVQQMDIIYDSVDFDDPISSFSYFMTLCQPFTSHSEEELIHNFKGLMWQMIKKAEDGSSNSAEVQAQDVMRSAAEKIHGVVREFNRDSVASTANLVSLVVKEAIESLCYLTLDDEFSTKWENWLILSG